jgi:hypothetical protein
MWVLPDQRAGHPEGHRNLDLRSNQPFRSILPSSMRRGPLFALLYMMLRCLVGLAGAASPTDQSKEVEILVLRHQLKGPTRQAGRGEGASGSWWQRSGWRAFGGHPGSGAAPCGVLLLQPHDEVPESGSSGGRPGNAFSGKSTSAGPAPDATTQRGHAGPHTQRHACGVEHRQSDFASPMNEAHDGGGEALGWERRETLGRPPKRRTGGRHETARAPVRPILVPVPKGPGPRHPCHRLLSRGVAEDDLRPVRHRSWDQASPPMRRDGPPSGG